MRRTQPAGPPHVRHGQFDLSTAGGTVNCSASARVASARLRPSAGGRLHWNLRSAPRRGGQCTGRGARAPSCTLEPPGRNGWKRSPLPSLGGHRNQSRDCEKPQPESRFRPVPDSHLCCTIGSSATNYPHKEQRIPAGRKQWKAAFTASAAHCTQSAANKRCTIVRGTEFREGCAQITQPLGHRAARILWGRVCPAGPPPIFLWPEQDPLSPPPG